ncbi:MAG: ATP-binding protein [Pseudomonadota bacterium]
MNKENSKNDINTNIKDYLDNIIEQIPYFIFWKNTDSVYLGCNQKFANLVNKKLPQEVIGETDFTLDWGQGESELFKYGDQEVMNGNSKVNGEEVLIRPDGSRITMLVNKLPMRDKHGNCIGILGTSVDITERKILEENLRLSKQKAEAANQAKTEFLENMRHDIRTPLSGIVGCAQLIQMQADNPKKVTEYADDLVQSSDALLEFLNKILESITVASGEIPLLKKRFNLKETLEQIVRLNRSKATVKKLALTLDYDDKIPTYLIGDAVRVQRIILELLTNALKYTDKGEVKVSARLMKNKTRTDELIIELRVSDTGMGIPRDKQNEVYTRFTRLVSAYKGIYPGTGLGLSVVKQFIDDLNGEIRIESEVGKGTTFICLIPLQESLSVKDENGIEEVVSFESDTRLVDKKAVTIPTSQENPVTTGGQVLVVEDNPIAAKVAKGILLSFNCQIDIAPDGKTALTLIEKNHYDLILMDIGLPDEEGCDMTRRLRLKQWQRNPSVPIIGLTAHVDEDKKRRCLENGMNAIYSKPLTPEKASGILNAFLSHSQASVFKENQAKSPDNLQLLPLLDKEKALKLLGSEKTLHELLALLESGLVKEIAELKQHHQDNNWPEIRALAHKWKGGSSYCGASRLDQVCQEIETALQAESREEAEVLYQQLLQVAEETKKAAKKVIS